MHSTFSFRYVAAMSGLAVLLASCSQGASTPLAPPVMPSGSSPGSTIPSIQSLKGTGPTIGGIPTSRIPTVIDPRGFVSLMPRGVRFNPHPDWMRLGGAQPLAGGQQSYAYVALFDHGTPVFSYKLPNQANNPPVCNTTDVAAGVNGIGVDKSGNLWVPQQNNGPGTGFTQEYGPNCGAKGLNIPEPKGLPSDVAVDSKGNIYVGDLFDLDSNANFVSGTVHIYDPTGKSIGKLRDPSFSGPYNAVLELTGVGIDHNDNCFVSHFDPTGAGEVVEFPGCKPASHGTILAGPHLWFPGKPQFDASSNLLVSEALSAYFWRLTTLGVYAPPYDSAPSRVIALSGAALSCPLDANGFRFYCADDETGGVDVYNYKQGAYQFSFNNGIGHSMQAIATVPTAQ